MQAKPTNSAKAPTPIWLFLLLGGTLLLTAWMAMQDNSGEDEDLVAENVNTSSTASPVSANAIRQSNTLKSAQSNSVFKQNNSVFKQNNTSLNAPSTTANTALLSPSQSATLWAAIQRPALNNKPADLFGVQSWQVIKKVKPAPPPAPTAPPVPYVYLGKLEDTPKGTQLFLMANNRVITAIKGDKIEGQWRLDAEDANSIRFIYLPLNLPQTLLKNATQPNAIALNQFNLNQNDSAQTEPVENNQ